MRGRAKNLRLGLALAAAFLVLATSCGGQGPGGKTETIEVQVSGEPEETAVFDSVAAAFEKDQPGVNVEMIAVASKDDHLAKLATSFAGGNPPDVFLVNYREYSQFVTRGAVHPVGPELKKIGIDLEAYYQPPIEAFTFRGALQCMPQNASSLVVYYNTDLFQQAGLTHPPDDWNWEQFRQTGLRLTRGGIRGLGFSPEIIRMAPFIWSNGGEMVDDLDKPTRFTLDSPAAREALEYMVSLARSDQVTPTEQEVAAQDLETRFVTGKLGMLLSSRRETPAFREVQGLNWDVAALPVAKQKASILHADGYCISAGSDHLDTAARFVRFATGNEGQTVASYGGRIVPSLKWAAAQTSFLDPLQPPAHAKVFLDALPTMRRTPVISTWPEIEDKAGKVLEKAFYEDGFTVDRAISEIDSETRKLFKEGQVKP